MIFLNVMNSIVKYFGIFGISYFTFVKVINYRKIDFRKIVALVLAAVILALLSFGLGVYIVEPFVFMISGLVSSILMARLTKSEIFLSVTTMVISLGISFISYMISAIIIALPLYVMNLGIVNVTVPVIVMLAFVLVWLLFRIRRFQNGFPFLENRYISSLGIFLTGVALAIYAMLRVSDDIVIDSYLIASFMLCAVGIYIWIKKGIKATYSNQMNERRIEKLEAELQRAKEMIEEYKEEKRLRILGEHRVRTKQKANRMFGLQLLNQAMSSGKVNVAEVCEFINSNDDIEREYDEFVRTTSRQHKKMPTTDIARIDRMFNYFLSECTKKDIDLSLIINGSISHMVEHVIPLRDLETLIGDHLEDAIIAVDARKSSTNRVIQVLLGDMDGHYELCIFDSGISFGMDTLLALGLHPVTEHAENGGSGSGFMSTFSIMKTHGASLIIDEKEPSEHDFSKSVAIRFNGENQYIIKSEHRANELRERNSRELVIS